MTVKKSGTSVVERADRLSITFALYGLTCNHKRRSLQSRPVRVNSGNNLKRPNGVVLCLPHPAHKIHCLCAFGCGFCISIAQAILLWTHWSCFLFPKSCQKLHKNYQPEEKGDFHWQRAVTIFWCIEIEFRMQIYFRKNLTSCAFCQVLAPFCGRVRKLFVLVDCFPLVHWFSCIMLVFLFSYHIEHCNSVAKTTFTQTIHLLQVFGNNQLRFFFLKKPQKFELVKVCQSRFFILQPGKSPHKRASVQRVLGSSPGRSGDHRYTRGRRIRQGGTGRHLFTFCLPWPMLYSVQNELVLHLDLMPFRNYCIFDSQWNFMKLVFGLSQTFSVSISFCPSKIRSVSECDSSQKHKFQKNISWNSSSVAHPELVCQFLLASLAFGCLGGFKPTSLWMSLSLILCVIPFSSCYDHLNSTKHWSLEIIETLCGATVKAKRCFPVCHYSDPWGMAQIHLCILSLFSGTN